MIKSKNIFAICKQPGVFGLLVFLIIISASFLRLKHLSEPNQYIFDEDYFAFTASLITQNQVAAYEYWHLPFDQLTSDYLYRPPAIEWLHPPVSKLLIAVSILIFDNNPVGWRLIPAISGIMAVMVTILLAIKLFPKQKFIAISVGIFMTIDSFLIVESRLAGANMILTALSGLTVLMTFIFWQKINQIKDKPHFWFYLALLGISAGLVIATKWSGVFIVAGCLIWLLIQIKRAVITHKFKLIGQIIVGLTITSLAVYLFSYGQFFWLTKFDMKSWFSLQKAMLTFQAKTHEQHAYQSRPWLWPLNQVAIPYYLPAENQPDHDPIWAKSMGLPIGFGALLISILFLVRSKNKYKMSKGEELLVVSIISYWLPWFFITRNLFLYHALPLLPLLYLLLSLRLFNLGQFLASIVKKISR